MRPVEGETGNRAARGDEGIAPRGDEGTRLGGKAGDRRADPGERDDPVDPDDGQPDRGEAEPAPGKAFAVTEPGRRDGEARDQKPASSADIATAAMACAVVSTAAVATWSNAAAA